MNKSEIAEKAAREAWKLCQGDHCDCEDCLTADGIDVDTIAKIAQIVERAIAESQAPQPEKK